MNIDVKFAESKQSFASQFGESNQQFSSDFSDMQIIHGKDGEDGKSAYEIAVDNGFEGTETEWLESLHGKDGVDGDDGKSAYEVATDNGFEGSEDEWLNSLHGKDAEGGIFIATQRVTTWDEVMGAINDGKFVIAKSGNTFYALSNYDSSLIRFSRAYQSTTAHITLNTSNSWAAGSTTHAKSSHTHADIEERVTALENAIANL